MVPMPPMPFMYINLLWHCCVHLSFAVAFNTNTFNSFWFRNEKKTPKNKKKKKWLPKLECVDKKLPEESCVRNFRNPLFAKLLLFEILGRFPEIILGKKILGVRNFRVSTGYHKISTKITDEMRAL